MAFNFGTPAAGNATGAAAAGTGFNFGASTPKPAFGAAAPAAFGATPAPVIGISFGSNLTPLSNTTQPATGIATTAAAVAPSFAGFGGLGGTAATIKPTGTVQPLTLGGTLATSAAAAAAPVLPTFGQATAAAAAAAAAAPATLSLGLGTGFGLGAPAAAQPAVSAAAPQLGGFAGFGLQQPAAAAAGATAATAAAPTLGLFGKPATTMTTATTASAIPSLFGAPTAAATSTAQPSAGLFGASTANTTGSLFAAPAATSFAAPAASTAPTAPTAATATAPKLGLGGIDTNAAAPKSIERRSQSARVKEAQLPLEITTTVEALKQHIKTQKQFSSDIARTSTHKLFAVSGELHSLNWALAEVANLVHTNSTALKQLRYETAGAIRQTEMAQRTHEIQPGLQFENNAPLLFFAELVQRFEADMILFRNQVELTEKHMRSLANPQPFTAIDLKRGLQQLHESFVALAGRLHETHQKVEAQKEQYLQLRKHLLRDPTNVFEAELGAEGGGGAEQTMANISCGPTPFSATFGIHLGSSSSSRLQQQQQQQSTTAGATMVGGAAGNATSGGSAQQNSSGFGLLGGAFGSQATTNTSAGGGLQFGGGGGAWGGAASTLSTSGGGGFFNLQNPPIGTKRNKQ